MEPTTRFFEPETFACIFICAYIISQSVFSSITSVLMNSFVMAFSTYPVVKQELLTLPEHPNSPPVRVTQSLVLCVMICRSLFVLFLLAIVLSVLNSSIYDSDYPFGIFKLFCNCHYFLLGGLSHLYICYTD